MATKPDTSATENPVPAEPSSTEIDDYSATFDALAAELTPPAAKEATTTEAPPKETVPAEVAPVAAVETPPAEKPETTPEGAKPAEEKPAVEPSPELTAALAKIAELEAAKPAAPAVTIPAPAAEPDKPLYTAEEQAAISAYEKDWPEIKVAEQLVRRAEYNFLVDHIFTQITSRYDHLLEFAESVSTDTQYAKIVELVPDYPSVRDATLAWVDKQPAYLKDAYTKVVTSGSPNDVADLIGRFKKETNYQAPAAAIPAASAATPAAPATGMLEATPAAKKAAAALTIVPSVRSEQVAGPDPNDFDSAFREFSTASK